MLFDELNKYKNTDHFFVQPNDKLEDVCNVPKNIAGVYLVFILYRGKILHGFIGSGGNILRNGKFDKKSGGLYNQIINGYYDGRSKNKAWPSRLKRDDIDGLDIYWYETYNDEVQDIPKYVASMLLQKHLDIYGEFPNWNKGV